MVPDRSFRSRAALDAGYESYSGADSDAGCVVGAAVESAMAAAVSVSGAAICVSPEVVSCSDPPHPPHRSTHSVTTKRQPTRNIIHSPPPANLPLIHSRSFFGNTQPFLSDLLGFMDKLNLALDFFGLFKQGESV